MITPALPEIEKMYSLGHGSLEWVVSIFLLGYVIGQLVYGPLANRFGRLNSLRIGLGINIIGIVICIAGSCIACTRSYPLLLTGRFITALGSSSGLVCAIILVNELLTAERAKKAMTFMPIYFIAFSSAAVTIGGIVTQYWKWQDNFWLLFIHGVVMLILTWVFQETLRMQKRINWQEITRGYLDALKSKKLVFFAMMVGSLTTVFYVYAAEAPLYAHKVLKLSASEYGYWSLVNMVGMVIGSLLSLFFLQKYEIKSTFLIGSVSILLAYAFLVVLSFGHIQDALLFFLATGFVFLFGSIQYPVSCYISSNAIPDKASASGMMSFINIAMATLGVVISGYLPLMPLRAFTLTIIVFFAIPALCAWGYLLANRNEKL